MTRSIQAVTHRMLHLIARLRALWPRLSGVQIGPGVLIGPGCEIALGASPSRRGTIVLGNRSRIERGVLLHPYRGRIETDTDVYIGPYTTIYGHGGVTIGKDTLISMHCRILSSNHAVPPPGTIIRSQPDVLKPTRIGSDVWLGAGVTVLGGVSLGDGCIVGAGAVVTKDLPAGSISHGIPAAVAGWREGAIRP